MFVCWCVCVCISSAFEHEHNRDEMWRSVWADDGLIGCREGANEIHGNDNIFNLCHDATRNHLRSLARWGEGEGDGKRGNGWNRVTGFIILSEKSRYRKKVCFRSSLANSIGPAKFITYSDGIRMDLSWNSDRSFVPVTRSRNTISL